MRIFSLLLILVAVSKSYAAYDKVLFTGNQCSGTQNQVTIDDTTCVNICGGYYKVTSNNNVFTLHSYTDNACATPPTDTVITCAADNAPFKLPDGHYVQCTDATTTAPTNAWINYHLTGGPSDHTCSSDVYFGVQSDTACIPACSGSFRVSRPYSAPTANHFQFNFFNNVDCSGTAMSTSDFTCGAEGVNVNLDNNFVIACSTAATPTPTGTPTVSPTVSPTVTPTTTGSAASVAVNVTFLLVALLFALL